MMTEKQTKVSWARILDYAPLILLIVLVALFAFVDSRIVSGSNLLQVLVQAAPIAVLSLGAMIVLISGGIDLSAGYGVGLCSVIVGLILTNGGSLFSAIGAAIATGIVIGLINGFFVGVLNIQSFIVTLGSMTVIQGATLFIATGSVLVITNPTLKNIGVRSSVGIPNIVLVTAILLILAALLIKQTSFGLRTYGIGSSLESSRSSGVPIIRMQFFIYIFSGVCTAVTAILLVSRVSIITPNIGGVNLILDAITATVIGGTSIFGGRGTIVGTLLGALIISLITQAMSVFGISASSLDFFKGLIIVIALAADSMLRAVQTKLDTRLTA